MCEIQPALNMKTLESRRVHRLCVFIVDQLWGKCPLQELSQKIIWVSFEPTCYFNFMQKIRKVPRIGFHKTWKALFWVHFDPKNSTLKKKKKKKKSEKFHALNSDKSWRTSLGAFWSNVTVFSCKKKLAKRIRSIVVL